MNSHYLLGFDGGTALAGHLFVPGIVFLPVSGAVATLSIKSQSKIIKAQEYCTSYLFSLATNSCAILSLGAVGVAHPTFSPHHANQWKLKVGKELPAKNSQILERLIPVPLIIGNSKIEN